MNCFSSCKIRLKNCLDTKSVIALKLKPVLLKKNV